MRRGSTLGTCASYPPSNPRGSIDAQNCRCYFRGQCPRHCHSTDSGHEPVGNKHATFRSLGQFVPGSVCGRTSPIAKTNTNQDPTCVRRCCRFVSRPQTIVPGLNTSKLHRKFLSVGPTRRSVRARVTAT